MPANVNHQSLQGPVVLVLLHTYEIQFNLRVAMVTRPDVEGRRCNLIYKRNSKAEARQVYTFDVVFACVAGFDSDVVVFRGMKIAEFGRALLTAMSACDTSERPVECAGRTYKVPVATLRSRFSDLKKTHLRHSAAEWTAPFSAFKSSINWVPA